MPEVGASNLMKNATSYHVLLFPKGCVLWKRKHQHPIHQSREHIVLSLSLEVSGMSIISCPN